MLHEKFGTKEVIRLTNIIVKGKKQMIYILIILMLVISFTIITYNKKKRRYKKVKPFSKMTKKEYRKAIKDLEIKQSYIFALLVSSYLKSV